MYRMKMDAVETANIPKGIAIKGGMTGRPDFLSIVSAHFN
jgi:hypothetical protein